MYSSFGPIIVFYKCAIFFIFTMFWYWALDKTKWNKIIELVLFCFSVPVTITAIGPLRPPYFNFSSPDTRFFNETDTANVTCYTDGTEPIDIFWIPQPLGCTMCQGCPIPKTYNPTTNRKLYIYNRSLVIPNVSRQNSTCYMVKAENKGAHNIWELVQVKVQCKYNTLEMTGWKHQLLVTLNCPYICF